VSPSARAQNEFHPGDPREDDALRSPVVFIGLFQHQLTITESEEEEGEYADILDLADALHHGHETEDRPFE